MSTAAPREIRSVTADDWAAIWPVFRDVVAAQETYAYDPSISSDEGRDLWLRDPPGASVVLLEDGVLLGTATMGPNRPGPGSHVGTASFMVAPQARGRGVGRELGEHVVTWHREQGYAAIQFNAVVATNTTAITLWASLGFTIVGTVPGAFDSPTYGRVGLHVMHREL